MLSSPQPQEDQSLHHDLHRELETSQGACAGKTGNQGKGKKRQKSPALEGEMSRGGEKEDEAWMQWWMEMQGRSLLRTWDSLTLGEPDQ